VKWLRRALGAIEAADAKIGHLEDQLDLNRDEFLRIRSCSGADEEIKQLCDRSQTRITQNVPVIGQRDQAEKERDEARACLGNVDTEFRAYAAEREGEDSVFGELWERVKAAMRLPFEKPVAVPIGLDAKAGEIIHSDEVEELDEDEESQKAAEAAVIGAARDVHHAHECFRATDYSVASGPNLKHNREEANDKLYHSVEALCEAVERLGD
jgi:hypothetical protein